MREPRASVLSDPEKVLRDVFGFPSFRPGQRELVEQSEHAAEHRSAAIIIFEEFIDLYCKTASHPRCSAAQKLLQELQEGE